jgi:hypothetical protein
MTWWTPIPLRWAEESEAKQVCALAALQREPYSGAVRFVEWVAPISAPSAWSVLWPRLAGWFACWSSQIK